MNVFPLIKIMLAMENVLIPLQQSTSHEWIFELHVNEMLQQHPPMKCIQALFWVKLPSAYTILIEPNDPTNILWQTNSRIDRMKDSLSEHRKMQVVLRETTVRSTIWTIRVFSEGGAAHDPQLYAQLSSIIPEKTPPWERYRLYEGISSSRTLWYTSRIQCIIVKSTQLVSITMNQQQQLLDVAKYITPFEHGWKMYPDVYYFIPDKEGEMMIEGECTVLIVEHGDLVQNDNGSTTIY